MHQLIYALVHASTHDEALEYARSAFGRLVGMNFEDASVFDYYVTFDEPGDGIRGADRWGDLPVAAQVDSTEGQTLLERGWNATTQEFTNALENVTEGLDNRSTEELMGDDQFRYHCHRLGEYAGPNIFLYNEVGMGIRHRDQLDAIRTGDVPDNHELWIVPADVHY